jgi:hypothetical protein
VPVPYFKPAYQNQLLPFQLDQITRAVSLYFSNLLYRQDNAQNEAQALARIIHTTTTAEMMGRDSIAKFQSPGWKFPFTAFSYGDLEPDKTKTNGLANFFNYYSPLFNNYISSQPQIMEFIFCSFFNTHSDYLTALKIFHDSAARLVRIPVPILVNGVTQYFPIDLEFAISKGQYTDDFEAWLRTGKFLDLVHSVRVHFQSIVIGSPVQDYYYSDGIAPHVSPAGIYSDPSKIIAPIDDIYLAMYSYQNNQANYITQFSGLVPDSLNITSVYPADGATSISSGSVVRYQFTVPIQEDTFEEAFIISPAVFGDFSYTNSGLVAIFTSRYGLTSSVTYTHSVNTNILTDIYGGHSGSGTVDFSFTVA